MVDDGRRVLPPYVNRADFDYEARDKGALHCWDSGLLQTPRGQWTRLETRLEGYPSGARRVLVILQVRCTGGAHVGFCTSANNALPSPCS